MTREEAKEIFINRGYVNVKGGTFFDGDKWRQSVEVITEWLKEQPCEDAISRQAVLEQINCWIGSGEYRYTNATDYLTKRIAELLSVHPVCTDGDCISRKQALYEFEQDQYHDDFCREHNIDHSISMEMVRIRLHDLPSVTCSKKPNRCKDCKYFEYDSVAKVDGIPLIVAHEICSRWGDGCKTREDGYCFLFEPQESEEKK